MIKKLIGRMPNLGDVIRRFPVAVLAMGVFTVIWIFLLDFTGRDDAWRLMAGIAVAAYLCVMITIARDVNGRSRLYVLQAVLVAALGVIFFFSESLRLNVAMAVGAVLLVLGNAVGWKQTRNDLRVWDFTHKIWTGAVMAIVGSIIFMLGMLAIMVALKTLLGIDVETLVTEFLMPIGFGFLAPLYWLSTVPPVDESYDELHDNPGFVSKAIGFLGTWLLAPLTLIYAAIILAYSVKILFAWELPKGEIAQLTTPFLIVGALTWLVLEPPFIQNAAIARWFRKLWFPVSIPAAIMLGIAVYVRIDNYGLTEERIALVLAVIWALGVGLWFTLKKANARDIRLVPGLGAALLLVGTFIATPLSISSQMSRMKALVDELGVVDGAGDITAIKTPTRAQNKQLSRLRNQLKFFYKRKAYKSISKIFPNVENVKKQSDLYNALEVENLSVHYRTGEPTINFNDNRKIVDVADFDIMSGQFAIHNYKSRNSNYKTYERTHLSEKDGFNIATKDNILTITHPDGHVAKVDFLAALTPIAPTFNAPLIIDIDARTRLYIKSLTMQEHAEVADVSGETFYLVSQMNFYVLTRD